MTTPWLPKTTIKAHVDRIRFKIEPAVPTTRAEIAANLPQGGCWRTRNTFRGQPRWHLKEIGETGTMFEVTVHDLVSMPAVIAIIDRMKTRVPLKADPALTILEIAVDVWPKEPGLVDLCEVLDDLFRGAKFEPSRNSRAAGEGRGSVTGLHGANACYRRLQEGLSLYNGNVGDGFMVRAYPKITDDGEDLPEHEHRARFEIEMRGAGLPVGTVRELGRFGFEALSPMFLMRVVREDLPPLLALLARSAPKLRRYPRKTRRARSFTSQAFTDFNKRVYRALHRLTIAMQSERGNPFRAGHVPALVAYMREIAAQSVRTDSFFHPPVDVTPSAVAPNRCAPLTTPRPDVQDDQDEAQDAA